MKSIIWGILLGIALLSGSSSTPTPGDPTNAIEQKLEALRVENELPGINFSVTYPDGRTSDFAVGFADMENQLPNRTDFKLLSGSIGKTYAAALIYQLVEAEDLQLEALFLEYFPDHPWLNRLPNIDSITIQMLLQHTSGLPRWVLKPEVWKILAAQPDKVWSYEERFAQIFDEPAVHPAGAGWAYSDTNYLLLGMLVEKLLKKPYYECLQERVLTPLQLVHTVPSNQRELSGLITSYSQLPASFQIPEKASENGKYVFNPQVEWTGGGIASTTHDLANWCKAYYEGALFADSLVAKMRTVNPIGDEANAPHHYGMASFIYQTTEGTAYGHSGFMPGFNAIMAYFPEEKIALALQINCDYAARNMPLVTYLEELLPVLK